MYKSGRDQDQDQAASSWLVTGQQRSGGGSHNGAFLEAGLYQTTYQTQALSDSLRNGHSSADLFCPQLTKQWKSKYPVKNRKNRQWPSRAVQICPLNNFCTRSGPMLHIVTHETKSVNGRFPELWATSHQIASSFVSKCVLPFSSSRKMRSDWDGLVAGSMGPIAMHILHFHNCTTSSSM